VSLDICTLAIPGDQAVDGKRRAEIVQSWSMTGMIVPHPGLLKEAGKRVLKPAK
jgi:hypothetical protein